MLLAAEPQGRKPRVPADAPAILTGEAIGVTFMPQRRWLQPPRAPIHAVTDVSLDLRRGETLGIVGESGSGKTTLGRALLRLIPCSGFITFDGLRISDLTKPALRPLRRDLQVVFQDPFGSLSPRMTIGAIVSEGLLAHEPGLTADERDRRACLALEEVGVDPAARNRFPHEFSGGQRQRIAIARAIILRPRLVLLDEPTSALDRTVQSRIVALLRDIQARHGLSYLFISHDLGVVRAMADRILVMKDGRIIEAGDTQSIVAAPQHSYTQALMRAAFPA